MAKDNKFTELFSFLNKTRDASVDTVKRVSKVRLYVFGAIGGIVLIVGWLGFKAADAIGEASLNRKLDNCRVELREAQVRLEYLTGE